MRDLSKDLAEHDALTRAKANALLSRHDEICRDYEKLLDARARVGDLEKGLDQWLSRSAAFGRRRQRTLGRRKRGSVAG